MADRSPLELTDLAESRPLRRSQSQRQSTRPKSTGLGSKAKSSARINQVAVATTPQKQTLYAIDDASPPQQKDESNTAFHRSRTAPAGGLRNSGPAPPASHEYGEMIDSAEVVALCQRLDLPAKDVCRLRKDFNDEDTDNTNTITLQSFFYLLREEKRALTKCLLQLAGVTSPSVARLSFDEFLQCVATFASFTQVEVLRFFFQSYADSTTATSVMTESDLLKLGQDLQALRSAFAGNVKTATTATDTGMASWTFSDFERFLKHNMVAFFPLLKLQRNVRDVGGLGDAYWARKTRQKQLTQQALAYMRGHHGLLPPLPLKDRVCAVLLQRPTTAMTAHRLAQQQYNN